jgi:hypothetical protein
MPTPQFYEVIIYEWPSSQICMDCKFGEFIDSKTFDASCYLCWKCCKKNDGVYCPLREESPNREESTE